MLLLALKFMVARGATAVLILVQVMLWSRLLEPDDYAIYALVMAAGLLLRAMLFSWLGDVAVRFLSDRRLDPDTRLAAVSTVFLALTLGLLLLYLSVLPWLGRLVSPPLAFAALLVGVLGGWIELSQQLSRARLEHRRLAFKMLGYEVLKLCLGVGLVLAGWRAFGLIGATTGAMLVTALVWLPSDRVRLLAWSSDWKITLAPMMRYGWPIALTAGVPQLLSVIDRFMLLWLIDEATAGRYALAFEMARQPVLLVMIAASTTALPLASRAASENGIPAAAGVLRSHATTLLLLALPATAIEVAFARPITDLILGAAYRDTGAAIMPLVALATFVGGWRSFHLDIGTHLIQRSRAFIGMWLAIVAINVALNAVLIPRFAAPGAAWATLLAQIGGVAYFYLLVPRAPVLGVSWRDVAKIAVGLGLAMPVAIALDPGRGALWLVISLGLGAAVYLLVLSTLRTGELRLPRLQSRGS